MNRFQLLPFAWLAVCFASQLFAGEGQGTLSAGLSVIEFLPRQFARDGSVSYQAEIQQAMVEAASRGETLRFPAMTYAVDQQGWQLQTGLTLDMRGATFLLGEKCDSDGAVFFGEDVSDIRLIGGSIMGRNDVWNDGVNIRGVHIRGKSSRIRISEMRLVNLSSNGIGMFGSPSHPIRDVWVEDVIVENCCKRYADYLSGEKGEPGSVREDQGDVAFYDVDDFVVRGCRFERSRSDGTHFYRSRNGQITDNRIYRAKMGGYFLEQCIHVVGRGNVILHCGSRGTTIERGSKHCVFADNVVRESGREGLWAPDCVGLVVTGNVFDRNGRKPNGPQRHHLWNANITINEAVKDPSNSPTQDYLVSDNLIRTTESQIAAIRVDAVVGTQSIVICSNTLLGENRRILVEGTDANQVTTTNNQGAKE